MIWDVDVAAVPVKPGIITISLLPPVPGPCPPPPGCPKAWTSLDWAETTGVTASCLGSGSGSGTSFKSTALEDFFNDCMTFSAKSRGFWSPIFVTPYYLGCSITSLISVLSPITK